MQGRPQSPRTENGAGNTPARPANVTSAGGSPGKVQRLWATPAPRLLGGPPRKRRLGNAVKCPGRHASRLVLVAPAQNIRGAREGEEAGAGRPGCRGPESTGSGRGGAGRGAGARGRGLTPSCGCFRRPGARAGAQMRRRRRGARAAREEPREAPGARRLGVEPQVSIPAGTRAHWRRPLGSPARPRSWFVFLSLGLLFSLPGEAERCRRAAAGVLARSGTEGCLRGGGTSGPSLPVHVGGRGLWVSNSERSDCFFHVMDEVCAFRAS